MILNITEKEYGIIINSLNNTFHKNIEILEKMENLGTIERQLLHQEKDDALELLKTLESWE